MSSDYPSYVDTQLWHKIQRYSKGDISEKIQSIDLIYSTPHKLPRQYKKILRVLAGKGQPYEVRLAIAKQFSKSPPPTIGERTSLLKLLVEDARKDLAKIVTDESQKLVLLSSYIGGFKIALDAFAKEIQSTGQTTSESGKTFIPIFNSLDRINEGLLSQTSGYYPVSELKQLFEPAKFTRRSKEEELVDRLTKCRPGTEHWRVHQTLCKDILKHCLCPPLLEPEEQVGTLDRLHRRDIIMHIPHNAEGLWNYILNKYGLALIIECKNYNEPLSENDVVISSKYLSPEKITSLGILLTRKGLTNSGEASRINQWKESKKLILCFTDDDLIKMLEFKVNRDDPGKVLDGHIRKFLESLS